MLDQSTNSPLTLDKLIGRPDPPPLRIHHIMAATAVVAVLLSISQFLRQSNTLGLSAFVASGQGILMTITAGLAATLTGFGFRVASTRTFVFQSAGALAACGTVADD